MIGAKWLRCPMVCAGLVLIGLAAVAVPARAATVYSGHTEIANRHDGTPWRPSIDSATAAPNANIFRSESIFSNGQGGARIWRYSGRQVSSCERRDQFLRTGECVDDGNPLPRVSNVPIPGAVWLFLSAVALLFGISFCRNTIKS